MLCCCVRALVRTAPEARTPEDVDDIAAILAMLPVRATHAYARTLTYMCVCARVS